MGKIIHEITTEMTLSMFLKLSHNQHFSNGILLENY